MTSPHHHPPLHFHLHVSGRSVRVNILALGKRWWFEVIDIPHLLWLSHSSTKSIKDRCETLART